HPGGRALVLAPGTPPRRGPILRESHPRAVSGEAPPVQLLLLLQLAEKARPRDDRDVPNRTGAHGLPFPIRNLGRVPHPAPRDVSTRPRLPGSRDGRVLGTSGRRI